MPVDIREQRTSNIREKSVSAIDVPKRRSKIAFKFGGSSRQAPCAKNSRS
jgi:hypothetical protein